MIRFEPPSMISSGESLKRYLAELVDKLNMLVSELDKKNSQYEQGSAEVKKELAEMNKKLKGLQTAVEDIKENM